VRHRTSSNARQETEIGRLTRERDEALEQQAATVEVLEVISSSPGDLQPVFAVILKNATRICEAKFGVLYLYDDTGFEPAALSNAPSAYEEFVWARGRFFPQTGNGLDRLLQTREVIYSVDEAAERVPTNSARLAGARSQMLVPMPKDGKLAGAIAIYRQEVRPFSDKQIALLSNFATQAVIAIENARLLNELRQRTTDLIDALEQQTATSEILSVISRSNFKLQPVMQSVVNTAMRLCRAEQAVIYRQVQGTYRFAAGHSTVTDYLDIEKGTVILPGNGTMIGRAALTRQVARIDDAWNDPLYEKKRDAKIGGVRSMIGVPLLREGEPIGVIGLARNRVEPFTDREIELVATFADQVVIAIENVRLFESGEARTRELAQSLDDLRAAQDRLVQTEKLASLGQLTAGIAHEIKNPLNFVNNFSAVSVELIDELRETLGGVHLDSKLRTDINEIADMLQGNLDKVVQHGKRADSIVKNMLLHSRQGSAEHRPVDINALVDESLNLAYHGARPRSKASLSPWNGPLTRPPARSICSRRRLRGCCST
jgi:GAF domain-containing protein